MRRVPARNIGTHADAQVHPLDLRDHLMRPLDLLEDRDRPLHVAERSGIGM